MLRSSQRWKPSKKLIAVYCVWALVLPSCGSRKAPAARIPQQVRSTRHGKVAYHPVKPKDLSQYIRGVYKVSAENYRKAQNESSTEPKREQPTRNEEIARLSAVLERNPGDLIAARALADIYRTDHRFLEALELYSRLEQDDPSDPEIQLALASIWDAWGNYPLALEHAAKALTPSRMSSEDWLFLGRIHLRGDNFAAAVQALRKSAELAPDQTAPLVELGNACFRRGDWETAVTFLKRALRLDERLNDSRRQLALSLVHLKLDNLALKEFLELEPAAAAYNDLGETQLGDRRWQDAIVSFSSALTADPSFEAARRNLARSQVYRPLAASVTLPSFDSLPKVQQVELTPSVAPEPTPAAQAAAARQIRPLILELDGAKTEVFETAGRTAPSPDLPKPIQVVEALGPVEKVVQLPDFPISAPRPTESETPAAVGPTGESVASEPARSVGAPDLISVVQTAIEVNQPRSIPVVDLSSLEPVASAPPFSFAPAGTPFLPVAPRGETQPSVWTPLETVTAPLRTLLAERVRLPISTGRLAPAGSFAQPAWALRPLESSRGAVAVAVEVSDQSLRRATADVLEGLKQAPPPALPQPLENPRLDASPVSFSVSTVAVGSPSVGVEPGSPVRSPSPTEAAEFVGVGTELLLSAISKALTQRDRRMFEANSKADPQSRFPMGVPNTPAAGDLKSASAAPAQSLHGVGQRGPGWTLTLLTTFLVGVLGAAFAYFVGIGPLLAVLIGVALGLASGSLLTLSNHPASATRMPLLVETGKSN